MKSDQKLQAGRESLIKNLTSMNSKNNTKVIDDSDRHTNSNVQ